MSDAGQEGVKAKRGSRPESGPNAELRKRREDRKGRGLVDHGFTKRFGLDESRLDHANYRWRWVNDTPGNVAALTSREWEVVSDTDIGGQEAARNAGFAADNRPTKAVLMRKWKEWFDEDQKAALELHRKTTADMMRGKSEKTRAPDSDGHDYAVTSNRVEDGVRATRNPDFEA
jgi:hypothetical protein